MKKIVIISTLVLNTFLGICYASPEEQSLDQMVAVVNDDLITRSELDKAVQLVKAQMAQSQTGVTPPDKTIEKQVLDQLINKKLQLQVVEAAGIKIPDDEVEKAITNIATQNNVSVEQLYEHVKQTGQTPASYRSDIREQIALQKLQQHEVSKQVTITPEEVTAFMASNAFKQNGTNEYRLQDILIPTSDTPSSAEIATAKTRAGSIMQKLRNGADFNALAKAESRGETALQGGDLGWRRLPEIPSAFADQITGMKKADLAGPIQTANGFHILLLTDVRKLDSANNPVPDRKSVEAMLLQQKYEAAVQNWVSRLRSQAFITASN